MQPRRYPCALGAILILASSALAQPANPRADQGFNSIAFTLGIYDQSIEPVTGPANAPLAPMDQLYGAIGYQRTQALNLANDPLLQKVALYAKTQPDGTITQITHAALQQLDGTWLSKLGDLPLIRHADPDAVDGPMFGAPVATYVRPRGAANAGGGMRVLAGDGLDAAMSQFDNGAFLRNDGNLNTGNSASGAMRMTPSFGFAQGMNLGGKPRSRSFGGATASSFAVTGGFGAGSAGNSSVSFGAGFMQAGQCCCGSDSTRSRNGGSADNTDSRHGKSAGNIFISINGNNDNVTINAGTGGLVGNRLRVMIKGDNDSVTVNGRADTTTTNQTSGGRTIMGGAGTGSTNARTQYKNPGDPGSLVGARTGNMLGQARHHANDSASGPGSLVGAKHSHTQAVARNAGNLHANSTLAISKNATGRTSGHGATVKSPGIAKTGPTSAKTAGATVAANGRTTFLVNTSTPTFARMGPVTSMLRSGAGNRTNAAAFTSNRSVVASTPTHVNMGAVKSAPANISLARRR